MTDARIVAILFTDLVGSTELISRLGDDQAERLRRIHYRLLRDVVATHGGHEVKSTGDGLMVVFPSAVEATSCAVMMQRVVEREATAGTDLQVRIGLHVGEPISHEKDFYGASVNISRRLCDAAGAGQILASEVVKALVSGRGFDLRSIGPLDFRGIPEPMNAFEVLWTPVTSTAGLASALAATPRYSFVARVAEREVLRSAWKRASTGRRRSVFIGGDAGIGKTRLVRELALEAYADGGVVLFGRCDEETLIPYQPLVEALRSYVASCDPAELLERAGDAVADLGRLVPEIAEHFPEPIATADPEVERYRLFRGVDRLLTAASEASPVLLICDDVHWADRATIAMIRHVMRSAEQAPILLVATFREDEVPKGGVLDDLILQLRRDGTGERVKLTGLDPDAVVALLEAAAEHQLDRDATAFAHALQTRTNGNPFYIEEIILHLVESGTIYRDNDRWTSDARTAEEIDIPDGVRETIARRLSRLSEQTADVLARASALGPRFSFAALCRLVDIDEDSVINAIEEGLEASLIVEGPDKHAPSYDFSHGLVREVLYDGMSLSRRQRLHALAATALEATGGTPLEVIVAHYRAAGGEVDPNKTVEVSLRAADAASRVFAYEDATAHLRWALTVLDELGTDEALSARLRGTLADLMYITGLDYEQGMTWLEEAVVIHERLDDQQSAARMRSRLGRALSTFDTWMDIDQGLAHFRTAMEVLETQTEGPALVHALTGFATAALYGLRTEEGLAASGRAMQIAERIGSESLWATGAMLRGFHEWFDGHLGEGDRLFGQALEVGDRLNHPTVCFFVTWAQLFLVGELLLDTRTAIERCDREISTPRTTEAPTQRELLQLHRDMCSAIGGDVDALRAPQPDQGADSATAAAVRDQFLAYHAGDWDKALRMCEDALEHRKRAGNRMELIATKHTLAWTLRMQGDFDRASVVLRDCLPLTTGQMLAYELIERCELAVACSASGRPGAAAELGRAREIVAGGEDWRGRAAWVDWAEGVVTGTDAAFARGVETLERYGAFFDQAELFWWWGRALRERGDERAANEKLDRATDIHRAAKTGPAYIERIDQLRGR